MLLDSIQAALATMADALASQPHVGAALRERIRAGARMGHVGELPAELRAATDALTDGLPAFTQSDADVAALAKAVAGPVANALLFWCSAAASRRDVRLAGLLRSVARHMSLKEPLTAAAHARVIEGPLRDALECAPLLGDGAQLMLAENAEARARLEILIWEAGAGALEVPALGAWIWSSASTFDAMIGTPAHGSLRGRVLAARCLEVSARGMPPMADPALVGKTLQVLQPLFLHPEPLVWVHAARALGRLTGSFEQLEGTVLDWALGESPVLRQRAMTAFASLPAERLAFLSSQLVAVLDAPAEADWVLTAVAAATPYLFFEKHELWARMAKRVLAGEGGAGSARALARGLSTLFRRGEPHPDVRATLQALRETARKAQADSLDEARRYIEVIAWTDAIDSAERDPLDLELGLENLTRIAAQYDDEEADSRAARFAGAVAPTFQEARRVALGSGRLRHRAAAINAVEGCARALALRLWSPLLATHPGGQAVEEPDLRDAWQTIARAPAELLDVVKERRQSDGRSLDDDLPLEILAVRLGSYALDACGEDSQLGPGRGHAAYDACMWLRKLQGLADGSRELPPALGKTLSALFWRLVDTTRGTALGEVDDVQWLGPFAAWWALVIDRPAMLLQLASALPMMADGALAKCCDSADALRRVLSAGQPDGEWGQAATGALTELHAQDTELAHALAGVADALNFFQNAAAPKNPRDSAQFDALCLDLVLAADRLTAALGDPVKALHPAKDQGEQDSLTRANTENAPRVAALVARAIRARDLSLLDVWLASLGPVASALIEAAIRGAITRSPPPLPVPKKKEVQVIEGYELIKPLGEGGIGTVWLVRKPGADRLFVLKIPKADALQSASETERAGILESFVEEAKALAGIYHPNVANIIDRGVAQGVPFLVLEYLIGADLKMYSSARLMTLFELRQVVLESCAGLASLHSAGLVHRDIKPANLWLRLPLQGGVAFDPVKHRDPAHAMPLSTVVIDFGMVRAIRVAAEVGGRFVAGTPGYIAPEQVLDPVELDPRADVYALAGTIYNVTTGRTFFDDIEDRRERILAHMRKDPFEDPQRLATYPADIAKLMRAATAKEPKDRPGPIEFGRAFAAAL